MDLNYMKDKLVDELNKGKNTLYFLSEDKDRFMVFYIKNVDVIYSTRPETQLFMLSPKVLNLLEFPKFARGYYQKGKTEGRYFMIKKLNGSHNKNSLLYNNFTMFTRDLSMFLYGNTDSFKSRGLHSYNEENKEYDLL
jgi:hypothetical protein